MRNIISYLRKMFKSKTTKGETQNIEDESKCNSIIDRYNQLSNGQKWWTSICALYFFVTLLLCGIAAFVGQRNFEIRYGIVGTKLTGDHLTHGDGLRQLQGQFSRFYRICTAEFCKGEGDIVF